MKKTLRAVVIVLALSCPAFAGDVLCPPVAPPPPPPSSEAMQDSSTGGDIQTGVTAPTADSEIQNEAAVTFFEVVLSLLALS